MPVLSFRRGAVGVGAAAVLAVTGTWVMWPADVDEELWAQVRPVIEARLVAESGRSGPADGALVRDVRWFCRARALELEERAGEVRAGVDALCVEYGVRDGSLVECAAGQYPQVVRLRRDHAADGGFVVVGRDEAPDGEEYARWTESHFGVFTRAALRDRMSPAGLETEARAHFGLAADAAVGEC
ncbi:hypothetical protein [Streptomyces hilarionis]|uniref:hypothetical protein n=1 Tax=Streptomyces hilarionis TaxID=2839954 RepID=UPI00211A47C8|nr:hypothetical protein [Streptomyces hilarionis]MCQ9135624.1 hypothetical protein [Streptomyces hilarionis]